LSLALPNNVTVSAVIPVKNAGEDLRGLLAMLRQQEGPRSLEIVVVDSGSTDASVDLAREFGARTIEIAPEQFSHSYARNLGAEYATGDYLLFTVQDALPPSSSWLRQMFGPFQHRGVVAVSCGEAPRPNCDLFYRAASWYHHKFLEIETADRILSLPRHKDQISLRKNAQLTDTACLIRKDIFSKYQYRGDYAEDLDLGLRLVRDGHRLALLGSTRIVHSHNRPAYYYLRRGYVDNLALLRILPDHGSPTISPEFLMQDIVCAFIRVDAVVRNDLAELSVPCSHPELKRCVLSGLDRTEVPALPASPKQPHAYLDDETKAFVDTLLSDVLVSREAGLAEGGIVIQAVRAFTNCILDFLCAMHKVIDAELLDDFRAALYKTWALQTGGLLATAYFHGDQEERVKLETIHKELTQGV
jgi:glycosyltransferase involved in cell wall biosynthesis